MQDRTQGVPLTTESITMTVEDAARVLGLGRTLAYQLAQRNELPGCFRIGGRYLVSAPRLYRHLGLAWSPASSPAAATTTTDEEPRRDGGCG